MAASQWEHKIETWKLKLKGFDWSKMEQDLNDLGRDGWEAVSTVAPSYGQGQAIEVAVLLRRPAGGQRTI